MCKGYLDLCAILHEQCKLLLREETLGSGARAALEIDAEEQRELRGMSVAHFRDAQEDFFLQAYFILGTVYPGEGEKQMLQVLANIFEQAEADAVSFEAFLFILQSIELALKEDEHPFAIGFVKQIFEKSLSAEHKYLSMLKNPLNLPLKRGFCNMVKDMASFYKHFPHLIHETIQIVLQVADSIKMLSAETLQNAPNYVGLQALYVEAIMDLCQHCPGDIGETEFALLRDHLTKYADSLQIRSTSDLMESLCCVCSHQADPVVLQQSFNNIAQIPVNFLNSVQSEQSVAVDRHNLIKAIAMVQGALKATRHLADERMAVTVIPMIKSIWDSLNLILQTRCLEKDLIQATCDVIVAAIKYVVKSPGIQQEQLYESLSKNMLLCFQGNHQNACCIRALAVVTFEVGKRSPTLTTLAMACFDSVCQTILQTLQSQDYGLGKNIDIDLIKDFAFFMLKCSDVNLAYVLTSTHFSQSVQAFSTVLESIHSVELNQQLIAYFTSLLDKVSTKFARQSEQVQQAFIQYYPVLLKALLAALSKPKVDAELEPIAASFNNIIIWSANNNQEASVK